MKKKMEEQNTIDFLTKFLRNVLDLPDNSQLDIKLGHRSLRLASARGSPPRENILTLLCFPLNVDVMKCTQEKGSLI